MIYYTDAGRQIVQCLVSVSYVCHLIGVRESGGLAAQHLFQLMKNCDAVLSVVLLFVNQMCTFVCRLILSSY